MITNDGLQEMFYIPIQFFDDWNRICQDNNLERFHFRTLGVPLGTPKTHEHEYVEKKLGVVAKEAQ